MSSVYTTNSTLTSILKKYSSENRDKSKSEVINRVRFENVKKVSVKSVIEEVLYENNYMKYNEFISYLTQEVIDDDELLHYISETRQIIDLLSPKFTKLVECLLSINWIKRNGKIIQEYKDFYITLMVAHNNEFTSLAVSNLILRWIPNETDAGHWLKLKPDELITKHLQIIHNLLDHTLNVIPMTFDLILESIKNYFPYYKKPSFVIGGYIHNMLWLLDYKPIFANHIIRLLLENLIHLDVNASRSEIEDSEEDAEDIDGNDLNCNGKVFQMDEEVDETMSHPIAETLDVCMEKLFDYIAKFTIIDNDTVMDDKKKFRNFVNTTKFFQIILNNFNDVILPCHNTHHVQFLIFYFCSFKGLLVEKFLDNLWKQVVNPNTPGSRRQTSVAYIASFLARAKFISLSMLKNYLEEMCNWAHQYIQQSDLIRKNNSLKAHLVFYSVCQSIFYVIAFRSKDLTTDKKSLLFLQSLQLSALVTSDFNPLKVCLPAIATAFSGVTRTYQLAYCHTILERNARRKLATVYTNEISLPEECLDAFFPFDPYLLKKSGKRINPIYLKYQASEAEEDGIIETSPDHMRRKRGDSEIDGSSVDDIDDFIIDKRQRLQSESSSINDKDLL